jgi:hypothetical protein
VYWSANNAGTVAPTQTATFTIATPVAAALTSPTASVLAGPKQAFTWTASAGASGYSLWLGTAAGTDNLYHSGEVTTTSATATGLPTNGETIYATLYTTIGTVSLSNSYTFAAATQAALTSPTPSTTLAGPKIKFSWSAATGSVTGYSLWLGTAAGTDNLYHSGAVTGTSVTVSGLPTNGEAIYATLYTYIDGSTVSSAYTYTAAQQAGLTSPAPSTTLAGPKVTFSWSAGTGDTTGYQLWLGTAAGTDNLYRSGAVTGTSVTATGLPTNGEPIYATLYTYMNGSSVSTAYTFTAATQAVLTSPASSTTLVGPKVTFSWSAGTGDTTGYSLWLGTTAGTDNVYHSGEVTTTSVTVSSLPTNGEAIYATLYTYMNGVTVSNAYTFTAAAQAVLTTPAPGSVLGGSSVAFTWTAGTGDTTGYSLWLGSTAGTDNLYHSGSTTATSVTATGLPTNGETIYATLYTYINGATVSAAYTYTASGSAPTDTPRTPKQ